MSSVLDKIYKLKKLEVERQKKLEAFESVMQRAQRAAENRAGKSVSFKRALKRGKAGNPAVIAELKRASPSLGVIRRDFPAAELALDLERSGAAALSVLTEKNFFMGDLSTLNEVSNKAKIPTLRKDFIFDEYQVCEAILNGASAVLLIAAMLTRAEYVRLFRFAKSLKLDVLSEAHSGDEVAMLLDSGADIVGVNCRNLADLSIDFSVSERLMAAIPDGIVRVCESAVDSRDVFLRAKAAGADAVLIGTALMSQKNPGKALKELLGEGL